MSKDNSPWSNAKRYKFWVVEILAIKAKPSDPVRYYTEVHVGGHYFESRGSRALSMWLAVLMTILTTKWLKS